jgi:NADH-quinone oxidoreductase subunit M
MSIATNHLPLLLFLAALVAILVLAPDLVARRRPLAPTLLNALLPALAMLSSSAAPAYALLGIASAAMAVQVRHTARVGAIMLTLTALCLLSCAMLLSGEAATDAVFVLSLIALLLRLGVVGLHAGVSSLCSNAPVIQAQQFASLLALVLAHLRFVVQVPMAEFAAAPVVLIGAASALLFALVSLVQRDLDGLLRASMLMHGGMMLAAAGAAGRGHYVAALFVSLTMTLALAGLSLTVLALEARVGKVGLQQACGRARSFPRLAAAFGLFGAAGVGMPGTSGFIADDLVLHALWSQSVVATIAVVLASALLAIATLRAITRTFMGPPITSLAPDLLPAERAIALLVILLLFGIGMVPQLVVGACAGLFEGG